ncbi:MAG TPA: hypothetical protein VL614_00790 [Acetobacteraceae bacterium]|jgi:hypothetical protein|nr:hypothetical protein [Acetobacteraceae bacterium]
MSLYCTIKTGGYGAPHRYYSSAERALKAAQRHCKLHSEAMEVAWCKEANNPKVWLAYVTPEGTRRTADWQLDDAPSPPLPLPENDYLRGLRAALALAHDRPTAYAFSVAAEIQALVDAEINAPRAATTPTSGYQEALYGARLAPDPSRISCKGARS